MFELLQYRMQLLTIGAAFLLHFPFAIDHAYACTPETFVQVGLAAPMTGSHAGYGKDSANPKQLAIGEVNAPRVTIRGNPVKFQRVTVDDQGDLRTAGQVTQQVVDSHVVVVAVITHFNSTTTLPSSQIMQRAGIFMISPATTNSAISQADRYSATRLKAKRIAILDDRTTFGAGDGRELEQTKV
ncbi:ABC-type branched-subunit amino acid transport system substrate-binding protein [Caballeronia udeis]|uniref:ABC-type branched-subunit amino acid transport system substrate-binding protein n=1 Tax=Caballeronia udeis TaxID=1232866 RepID=A0ABW8MX17_9BURK